MANRHILTSPDKATVKQRKWIKEYLKSGNATDAARKAGYGGNTETLANIGWENVRKLDISELMEQMGLTDIALVNVGAEGMTKPIKQSMTGEIHPDYAVRHKYWETMLKLKKRLDNKDESSGNAINIALRFDGGFNPATSGSAASRNGMEQSTEIQGVSVAPEG